MAPGQALSDVAGEYDSAPLFFCLTFFCPLYFDVRIAAFQTAIKWGTIRAQYSTKLGIEPDG
jgi:hypothetical protein